MELGDIYALGNHRLMCGDATRREDVLKLVGNEKINLVLTDPPYGIRMREGYSIFCGGRFCPRDDKLYKEKFYNVIIGDNSTDTARENYYIIRDLCGSLIIWGGQFFADFLPVNKCWLVWNKKQSLPNHAQCELAYTNIKAACKIYTQHWNGAIKEGSRKLNPLPRVHMTQKPVELHMSILQDFSKEWDVILDCFAGSGTTLIACEMTGRKCLTMEISPEYCEIICKRFEKLTGIKPVKL